MDKINHHIEPNFTMPTAMNEKGEVVWALPTLRDQFAMAALTGLLANEGKSIYGADITAERAWKCADVMLKQRGK